MPPAESEPSQDGSPSESSSEADDEGARAQYRSTKQYQALPAHVREAIDKVQERRKHSEFYDKLKSLNKKIKVFQQIFYTQSPAHERRYQAKQQKVLEEQMREDQNELEQFWQKHQKQGSQLRNKRSANFKMGR